MERPTRPLYIAEVAMAALARGKGEKSDDSQRGSLKKGIDFSYSFVYNLSKCCPFSIVH